MRKVLDAHGLLMFLEREKGFQKVADIFLEAADKKKNVLMSAVNFGEIYYIILREQGEKKAREVENIINALPIEIINADISTAKEAAVFKAFKKLSYADCFGAALAKINRAELITGDMEFKEVEDEIKILWL